MIRYILTYKDENIYKDGRSFKSKKYAYRRAEQYRENNRAFNSVGPNPIVKEIQVDDEVEKLQNQIKSVLPIIDEVFEYMEKDCRVDHNGLCQEHGLQYKEDCFIFKLVNWTKQVNG